jgi:dTDP-glucose pyrophosphorylase
VTIPAVVMAAGIGSRLRPLTEHYAKAVLPIDGVPVLPRLLRELAAGGCPSVTIVTGHLAEQVEHLAGDGSAFGVPVAFARQQRPDGSADAVATARASAPYLVVAADTLFTVGDVGRFAAEFAASGAAGALALRRRQADEPARNGVLARDGFVERLLVDDPASRFTGAPLWGVAAPVAAIIETLPGRPPFELGAAFQQAIDAGEQVAAIEIGPTRDLTAPVDLLLENFPYLGDL